MIRTVFFILGFLILFSCKKEEQIDNKLPDGIYVGTFQREYFGLDCDTANVTFTFTSNQWSGYSDMVNYPSLCYGTYLISGDTIIFENKCFWTADFDWSLILNGKYVLIELWDGFFF